MSGEIIKSDVSFSPIERFWSKKSFNLLWSELWPPTAVFALYIILLGDYWTGEPRLPFQDTLHIYETFATAYNHFFQTGELPLWLPYSNYGMPIYLQNTMNFPPFYIVTFALGAGFNIRNIWRLFEFAIGIDVVVFTLGTYLLARQFSSRAAAAVITAGMVWTLVLEWNIYFTLRLVDLMPLSLFFLVHCVRHGSLVGLFLAGCTVLLGCFGVPQYFAPFYAFFYLSSAIALWAAYRPELRISGPLGFAVIAIFATAIAGAIIYFYLASIYGLYFIANGRDPISAKTDLNVFLNFGGTQILKLFEPFVAVPTESKTSLFYSGSVALVLTAYALWRLRTRELWAFIALLVVFVLFCLGPYAPVAPLAYYFPGMSYFRHVGIMHAVPKVVLGVIAAIGLDAALAKFDSARPDVIRVAYIIGLASILIAIAYFPLAELLHRHFVDVARPSTVSLIVAALGGFALVGLIFRRATAATIVPLLLLTTLIQGAAYQHLFRDNLYRPWHAPAEITRVHPVEFLEIRDTDEIKKKELYDGMAQHGVVYAQLFSFLQIDPCAPAEHFEYITAGVHKLMQRAFGNDIDISGVAGLLSDAENPPAIARVLGCGVSKVQWVPGLGRESAATGADSSAGCVDDALCVESSTGARKAVPWPTGGPPAALSLSAQGIVLDRFSFNDIAMTLTVDSKGWLVYADAFFPGWRAKVDGKSVPVWRANFAFKAVELDSGHHKVQFYFYDPVYKWALWGSGVIGTAAILALLIIAFFKAPLALQPRHRL